MTPNVPDAAPRTPDDGPEAPDSALSHHRAVRQAQARGTTKDVPVPGWSGLFGVRFRTLDAKTLAMIDKRGNPRDDMPGYHANVDALIEATVELLYRPDSTAPWEALLTDGKPAGWNIKLCNALGVEPTAETARACLVACWPSDLAVMATAELLADWSRGEMRDTEEAFRRD
jgi:hypothetical protein